ncbi:hypothetical protein Tco_0608125 [Tanacetum coccineum]
MVISASNSPDKLFHEIPEPQDLRLRLLAVDRAPFTPVEGIPGALVKFIFWCSTCGGVLRVEVSHGSTKETRFFLSELVEAFCLSRGLKSLGHVRITYSNSS